MLEHVQGRSVKCYSASSGIHSIYCNTHPPVVHPMKSISCVLHHAFGFADERERDRERERENRIRIILTSNFIFY